MPGRNSWFSEGLACRLAEALCQSKGILFLCVSLSWMTFARSDLCITMLSLKHPGLLVMETDH